MTLPCDAFDWSASMIVSIPDHTHYFYQSLHSDKIPVIEQIYIIWDMHEWIQ